MNQEDLGNQVYSNLRQLYDSGFNYSPFINQAYGAASQNLMGQERRDVSSAGNQGYAQAASMNLSNPYSLMQRYQNQTQANYAPQFGQLYGQQANALFQGRLQGDQNRMNDLNLMMQTGKYLPQSFSFGQDVAPGLAKMGLSIGGALIGGPVGAAIGGSVGNAAFNGGASQQQEMTAPSYGGNNIYPSNSGQYNPQNGYNFFQNY